MKKRRIIKALRRLKKLPKNKYLVYYIKNKIKQFYLKLIKSTKVAYPSTLMIELTNHCNLACTICPREYDFGHQMDKGRMTIDQAKTVIDEAFPYLDSIGLTGLGETFMFKELTEIVDYIQSKKTGIIISISTNAVLPNFIEKVKPIINKIDTIQISIDGLNEVYDKIRLKGKFSDLDKNIKTLASLCKGTSTELMLNMVVTEENYLHMPLLVPYSKEVGVQYLDFSMFNVAAVTNIEASYYNFYESEKFQKIVTKLDTISEETKEVEVNRSDFKTSFGFKACNFPWSYFYISQDSYIPPCCAKPFPKEKSFGSVKEQKLIEVLNNENFVKWRKMWFKNETPDFCKKCNFISEHE